MFVFYVAASTLNPMPGTKSSHSPTERIHVPTDTDKHLPSSTSGKFQDIFCTNLKTFLFHINKTKTNAKKICNLNYIIIHI